MNDLPAMHFPLGARGNNFDSQIKIIYSWSKRIPFPFCAWSITHIHTRTHTHIRTQRLRIQSTFIYNRALSAKTQLSPSLIYFYRATYVSFTSKFLSLSLKVSTTMHTSLDFEKPLNMIIHYHRYIAVPTTTCILIYAYAKKRSRKNAAVAAILHYSFGLSMIRARRCYEKHVCVCVFILYIRQWQ